MTNYQVRADVYPATFTTTTEDGKVDVYDKVRVVLTLDRVFVFQDHHPDPVVVFEDRLTSYTPPVAATRVRKASQLLDRSAKLETEDGFSAVFIKSGGCGCGSRLKNMSLTRLMPNNSIGQAASTNDS